MGQQDKGGPTKSLPRVRDGRRIELVTLECKILKKPGDKNAPWEPVVSFL